MISCSLGLVVPRAYCSASRSNGAAGKTALHEKEITVSCSVLSYPWPPRSAWRLPYRPALIRMTQGSAPLAEGCSAPVREPRSADWQVEDAVPRRVRWSAARSARSGVRRPPRGHLRRRTTHRRHRLRRAITSNRLAITRRRAAPIENDAGARRSGIAEHRDRCAEDWRIGAEQPAHGRMALQQLRRPAFAQRRDIEMSFGKTRHRRPWHREGELFQ